MTSPSHRSLFAHPMGKWGLFLAALFALWFGGWFAFASYADGKIGEIIDNVQQRGITIDCVNRDMRGFPFRIGVHCDSLLVDRQSDLFSVELGAVRTAAQLYAPGELIAEIDGPYKSQFTGLKLEGNWSAMRLFLDAKLTSGFDLASLTFSDFSLALGNAILNVADGAVHFRPTPTDEQGNAELTSLDGAVRLTTFAATLPAMTIPDATLEADATLQDGYQDLILDGRRFVAVLRDGAAFDIRNLALSLPDGGRLAIAGPLTVGEDGLLSGKISIGVDKPESVSRWAGKIDPGLAHNVGLVAQAVAGMGTSAKFGDTELRSIVLTIDRGMVRLGFIQLPDKIPPLFRN